MNLQGITAPYINSVNPWLAAQLQISTGYTTNADGTRVPQYTTTTIKAQTQALSFRDIQMIEGLELNGERRAMYLQGNVQGLVRQQSKGGDLITLPNGTVWIVAMVLESWQNDNNDGTVGWCKVAVTQQM